MSVFFCSIIMKIMLISGGQWISHPKSFEIERGIISYFGARSDPCCMRAPILCQRQLSRLRPFSNSSGSDSQGWALSHSWGLSLKNKEHRVLTMFFHNINRFKYTLSSAHFKSITIIFLVHHVAELCLTHENCTKTESTSPSKNFG